MTDKDLRTLSCIKERMKYYSKDHPMYDDICWFVSQMSWLQKIETESLNWKDLEIKWEQGQVENRKLRDLLPLLIRTAVRKGRRYPDFSERSLIAEVLDCHKEDINENNRN